MGGRKLYLLFLMLRITWLRLDGVHGEPQVPCYFIFGDSLVDSGNNNNLATMAKVDYLPYGIDFPGGPTGRFCNGRTTADIIGELLGFEDFIPSFSMSINDSQIMDGINYASGSAGILEETGKVTGSNIELNKQIENHRVVVSRIVEAFENNSSTTKHLNKCLYLFVIGSNDYISNYFLPQFYNTSSRYNLDQYAELLVDLYAKHIMRVYNFGGRLFALTGIGPIGCTPGAIASHGTNGSLCVDSMNEAVSLFNLKLQFLVNRLNTDLTDANVLYLDAYGFLSQYIASPAGLEVEVPACCKVNESGRCIPYDAPCKHRNLFLFWDSFHPTEIANRIGGGLSYLALRHIL